MFEAYILSHPWAAVASWGLLYTADYYLTIWGAKAHKKQEFMSVEGSYELNPDFQKDVDNLRLFSWTFLLWLIGGAILLLSLGALGKEIRFYYETVMGFLLVPEMVVMIRHADNILKFSRFLGRNPGIQGRVVFSRAYLYWASSINNVSFAVFMLLLFALVGSPIFLGGVLGLAYQAWHDAELGRKARAREMTMSVSGEENESAKIGTDV